MMPTLSNTEMLDQFAQKARKLYTLPAVAAKVLELTDSPSVDIQALKACIEQDPSLATKLLSVVNSSLFGLSRKVGDLNQTLALLGVKPLKLLVLGFSLPKALTESSESETLSAYWKHALIKSVAAREISLRFWGSPGDDAFLAALLQNVGVLVLTQDLGEPYVALRHRALAEGADMAQWEKAALGFQHIALSARLLEHWQLPENIVRAVGVPHDAAVINQLPENERVTPQILHLAELTARLLAEQADGSLTALLETGRQYRKMQIDETVELLLELEPKIQQLSEVLAISFSDELDCAAIIERAHAKLALLAEETATSLLERRNERTQASEPQNIEEVVRLRRTAEQLAAAPVEQCVPPASSPAPATKKNRPKKQSEHASSSAMDDPGLLGRITSGVAAARKSRTPLSLLMVEINALDELSVTAGCERVCMLLGAFEKSLNRVCGPRGAALLVADGRWALVVDNCERSQAVEYARNIVEHLPEQLALLPALASLECTISVGAATVASPPKNFPASALTEAAERCIYAARGSGGGFKSIEIY